MASYDRKPRNFLVSWIHPKTRVTYSNAYDSAIEAQKRYEWLKARGIEVVGNINQKPQSWQNR